jgi:hypothetical protein
MRGEDMERTMGAIGVPEPVWPADAWPERTRDRRLAAALDCSAFLGAIADAILSQTPFVGENEHNAVLAVVGYLIGCESAWRWLVEGEGVVPPAEIEFSLCRRWNGPPTRCRRIPSWGSSSRSYESAEGDGVARHPAGNSLGVIGRSEALDRCHHDSGLAGAPGAGRRK